MQVQRYRIAGSIVYESNNVLIPISEEYRALLNIFVTIGDHNQIQDCPRVLPSIEL
jgi:hypothetical protein